MALTPEQTQQIKDTMLRGGDWQSLRYQFEHPKSDAPDAEAIRKANLSQQAGAAGSFANQGEQNYGALTAEAQAARDYLRRIAEGKDSVSAEQLRQGLQQNVAAQRSMAAGASPQNAAMAARTAAIQSARLGSGLAGQQAIAGLQERQAAQSALNQAILGARGQDSQVALGSRQNAINGYSAGVTGAPPVAPPSTFDKILGAAAGVAPLLLMGRNKPPQPAQPGTPSGLIHETPNAYGSAPPPNPNDTGNFGGAGFDPFATYSDKRLKKDVRSADADANKTMSALKAYAFKYKDAAHGKGEQLGVMAQDLERAGLGHAVFDTPTGKAVHGAKLATSNTAMLSALARRVGKLEGGTK